MKKILTAAAISLFVATPVVSFAQSTDTNTTSDTTATSTTAATYPESGGAAGGLAQNQTLLYSGLAAVGVAAVVGGAFALANTGDDDKDVNLGGPSGTPGSNPGGTPGT